MTMVLPVHVADQGTALTSPSMAATATTTIITPERVDDTSSASTTKTLPRQLRKRTTPYPNTILDTVSFIRTLEELNLYGTKILPIHILSFYQALHRQHYPTLTDFVNNYYTNERKAQMEHSNRGKNNYIASNELDDTFMDEAAAEPLVTRLTSHQPPHHPQQPLKNRISNKKNFNRMQLPKALLEFLRNTDQYVTLTSKVVQHKTSSDRTTTKLIIQLHDEQIIESVIMRYTRPDKGGTDKEKSKTGYGNGRASLCVSSQCGCAMGCTFCATGTMGLSGNLSMGEILEQIIHADRILADEWNDRIKQQLDLSMATNASQLPKLDLIRNVVFMGMGEPLDNYDNVVAACRALTDNRRWNIAHSRVTVSTVGIVDKIRKLTEDLPEVSLAVSLHAPNQDMRTSIVPSAKRYPIEELIDALDNHMMTFVSKHRRHHVRSSDENPQNGEFIEHNMKDTYTLEERTKESTRRRAMVEYVMLEGPTSSIEAAHQLGKLCEGRQLVVNLIPYNQTDVKDQLRCPSEDHMQAFRNIVASYGSFCTIRRTMGADIDSACGQLVTLENKRKIRRSTDIEDAGTSLMKEQSTKNDNVSILPKTVRSLNSGNRAEVKADDIPSIAAIDFDTRIHTLVFATMVSAACFVATTYLYLHKRNK